MSAISERDDAIIRLWNQGLTGGQIVAELQLTAKSDPRNIVAGVINRAKAKGLVTEVRAPQNARHFSKKKPLAAVAGAAAVIDADDAPQAVRPVVTLKTVKQIPTRPLPEIAAAAPPAGVKEKPRPAPPAVAPEPVAKALAPVVKRPKHDGPFAFTAAPAGTVHFADLGFGQCHFPIEKLSDGFYCYCGKKTGGKSYCPDHQAGMFHSSRHMARA